MEKGWLKGYFHFSKKERNAFIIFSTIIVLLLVFPFLFKFLKPSNSKQTNSSSIAVDSIATNESIVFNSKEQYATKKFNSKENEIPIRPTYFNPNSVTAEQLMSFGMREKLVNTILNYRSKGGFFKSATDISKIYGIRPQEVDALIPYIKIPAKNIGAVGEQKFYTNAPKNYTQPSPIDVNTATNEQWQALPGIGEKLASRIINYRNSRKGFKTIDDVATTYGISAETFNVIRPYLLITNSSPTTATTANSTTVKLVNINQASENTLSKVPGITNDIAKAIVIYRSKYGAFASTDELKKIVFISDDLLQTIKPFITAH